MKAFLTSILAIVVISLGAFYVLQSFDTSVAVTYSDSATVRLDPDEEKRIEAEE
ncbi:MAG: hypothetical protein RIC87_12195 [Kiloniellales bacterium]